MNPRTSTHTQSFFGTLEQCVEQYGGKSAFTMSAPVTFFSGARLESHRRAQSKDGSVVIIERQLGPTTCEIYVQPAAIRPMMAQVASASQAKCA